MNHRRIKETRQNNVLPGDHRSEDNQSFQWKDQSGALCSVLYL